MEKGDCKCWAWKMVCVGILVLAWNWYLTGAFFARDWPTFIGVLLVLKGIIKMVMPPCSCEAKPAAKKK
jgi:hypothetical protein